MVLVYYLASSMRELAAMCGLLLLMGCSGQQPQAQSRVPSVGGLWAERNLELEMAMFRLTDAQRAVQARAFEVGLADESLAMEQARMQDELQICPGGARLPLALSVGDRARDTIRIRVYDDPVRIAAVARVALADWRVRRARATGDSRYCDQAHAALVSGPGNPGSTSRVQQFGPATVSRENSQSSPAPTKRQPMVDLSLYALGWTDTVTSDSPLPQYLAAVYGGRLLNELGREAADPAVLVDEIAPAYPEWEPDALYVTFAGS